MNSKTKLFLESVIGNNSVKVLYKPSFLLSSKVVPVWKKDWKLFNWISRKSGYSTWLSIVAKFILGDIFLLLKAVDIFSYKIVLNKKQKMV